MDFFFQTTKALASLLCTMGTTIDCHHSPRPTIYELHPTLFHHLTPQRRLGKHNEPGKSSWEKRVFELCSP